MSKEILEGVKLVEKEKGIEPGTLLAAIEDALLAAYRKMPDARHPVRVDLDRDTGDFTAWTVTDDAWRSTWTRTRTITCWPRRRPSSIDPAAPIEDAAEEPEPEIEWDWFTGHGARRRDARTTSAASPARPPSRCCASGSTRPSGR